MQKYAAISLDEKMKGRRVQTGGLRQNQDLSPKLGNTLIQESPRLTFSEETASAHVS